MADIVIQPVWQVLDGNGSPVPGAKASFYNSGTTTPQTVYTDTGLSVAHASPVVADANGIMPPVYLSGALAKAVITTSADVAIKTVDPIPKSSAGTTGAAQVSFAPTADIASLNVQDAIEAVQQNMEDSSTAFVKTLLDDASATAFMATLGSSWSVASGGSYTFPGGLIIKWGTTGAIAAGGGNSVTFGTPFPTAIFGVLATAVSSANNTNEYSVAARGSSVNGTVITNNSATSGSVSAFWVAFGN